MECESCNELTEIEANTGVQLEQLHERHRQARVMRNYTHSPLIHQFPLEIVTYIFNLAFQPPQGCPWCSPWCTRDTEQRSPLVLTMVCHTWRALALSTPRLWSFMSVNAKEPNIPLLNHQIAHSGVVPLVVYLFGPDPGLPSAKQAMSLVIKLLHRTARLYLNFNEDDAMVCGSVSDLDYPKTAPFLKDLHFHAPDVGPTDPFQFKLAIEPPSPQEVHMDCISFDHVCLDWTRVSSLTVDSSRIQMLPSASALTSLKHLVMLYGVTWDLLLEQRPVVSQSIQDVTHKHWDPRDFILAMTLPALRSLDVDVTYVETLNPIIFDFLHRSLCPLQVLSIDYNGDDDGEEVIQALISILEITTGLQQLTLRLLDYSFDDLLPPPSFETLVRRLVSHDRDLLPILQSLSLVTIFTPPIHLLLDAMAPNDPEVHNGPNRKWTLRTLDLELKIPPLNVGLIRPEILVQILQIREAEDKKISIRCAWTQGRLSGSCDLIESWKSYYGFRRD